MSGHSKFANIKHRKERNDAKRGKVFTRLGREIAIAVKSGGADPSANGKLRDIIAKAKSENMPNDSIDRSIKKAVGDLNAVNFEEITYEGYGPGGVAVIVEVLTDNRNRTAANVRGAFHRGNGNMGAPGCVSFMFEEKGVIMVERDAAPDEDALMMLALEAGASDFAAEEEGYEIDTDPADFSAVREALERAKIEMASASVTKVPSVYATLTAEEDIKKMNKLLDILDEEDDVQNVWHNWAL